MAQVLLSAAAQEMIHSRLHAGTPPVALVITPDAKTDTLMASFIEVGLLTALKTRLVSTVLSGMEVHTFGINVFAPETIIELSPITLHPGCLAENRQGQHLESLFRVQVDDGRDSPISNVIPLKALG